MTELSFVEQLRYNIRKSEIDAQLKIVKPYMAWIDEQFEILKQKCLEASLERRGSYKHTYNIRRNDYDNVFAPYRDEVMYCLCHRFNKEGVHAQANCWERWVDIIIVWQEKM